MSQDPSCAPRCAPPSAEQGLPGTGGHPPDSEPANPPFQPPRPDAPPASGGRQPTDTRSGAHVLAQKLISLTEALGWMTDQRDQAIEEGRACATSLVQLAQSHTALHAALTRIAENAIGDTAPVLIARRALGWPT